jgi:phosphoribosylaminoimidazole-succinocarboxamide synthase
VSQAVVIADGKTKRVLSSGTRGIVYIESKDDITAGDGARHDVLEGKAAVATRTTCNVFSLLEMQRIPTHFLGRIGPSAFSAYQAAMVPLELVARRVATGSFLERHPEAVEGEIFGRLVFEFFHKDDAVHDPLVVFNLERGVAVRYPAHSPEGTEPLDEIPLEGLRLGDDPAATLRDLESLTRQVFVALEYAWAGQEIQLVDLKIECGWVDDRIVVADVIDNDSWRIWPAGDKKRQLDKQVYRDLADAEDSAARARALGKIKQNYAWVADATRKFVC